MHCHMNLKNVNGVDRMCGLYRYRNWIAELL